MNFSNVDGELDRQFPLHALGRGADRPPCSSFRRDAYFSLAGAPISGDPGSILAFAAILRSD
jgi:hypothetical protein